MSRRYLSFNLLADGVTIPTLTLSHNSDTTCKREWEFTRVPYLNLQVYYDSYVASYGTSREDGIANISDQIETLKEVCWETFGIFVKVYGPTYVSTYADECPTLATTGVCSCGDCSNSLNNGDLQSYHHTNYTNILLRLPECGENIDAVALFIGHLVCDVDSNGVHREQFALGGTSAIANLIFINDIGTYEDGVYHYDQVSCTSTFIHEVGHLFFAPDHYDYGTYPSTDEINQNDNYNGCFSPLCLYGELRSQAAESLTICPGCQQVIYSNRDKYVN